MRQRRSNFQLPVIEGAAAVKDFGEFTDEIFSGAHSDIRKKPVAQLIVTAAAARN